MGLRELFGKSLSKDPRLKEMEDEMRIRKMAEEKLKSANERELERFYEEEREKQITKNLEEFRKMKRDDAWSGDANDILKQKNIFKGHKNILDEDKSVLDNGPGILNQKNIFAAKHNKLKKQKGGSLYFK